MTLAILSALPEEQSGLVHAMTGMECVQHAGRSFWRGRLQGVDVVCALSGIGKVAAATTTTALIERFGVQAIVFTGVAGGLGEGVNVGDIVIASHYLQHDMDASPIFPRWQLPGYGQTELACDDSLSNELLNAARLALQDAELNHQGKACVHHGLIASGDQFIGSATGSNRLRDELQAAGHQVLAVEMEGAAVAQTCLDYAIPFAAMRTISDRADDSAHVDFSEFVRTVASRYAQQVMTGLLAQLASKSVR